MIDLEKELSNEIKFEIKAGFLKIPVKIPLPPSFNPILHRNTISEVPTSSLVSQKNTKRN
jgi:hypothetical protein